MSDVLPVVLRRMLGLWNGGDIDPADVYAAGCGLNGAVATCNPEDVAADIERLRSAIPDLSFTVDEWFGAGSRYVLRMHASGSHTGGPLKTKLGLAEAAGTVITFGGLEVFEVRDERIVDVWLGWDWGVVYEALGATL